jgi:hypothetical protein
MAKVSYRTLEKCYSLKQVSHKLFKGLAVPKGFVKNTVGVPRHKKMFRKKDETDFRTKKGFV